MREGFPRLVRRIRQKWRAFEYCAIWELTKANAPHIHIAAKGPFIPYRWLSHWLPTFGFGRVCDLRKVHGSSRVAHYMAKYMAKDIHKTMAGRFFKRVVMVSAHFRAVDEKLTEDQQKDLWRGHQSKRPLSLLIEDLVYKHGFTPTEESRPDRLVLIPPVDVDSLEQLQKLFWTVV